MPIAELVLVVYDDVIGVLVVHYIVNYMLKYFVAVSDTSMKFAAADLSPF